MIFSWPAGAIAVLILMPGIRGEEALNMEPVERWIERSNSLRSVAVDFVQVRKLRTLRFPQKSTGHLDLKFPDQFVWKLGEPPRTIAIRDADTLLVLQPSKKQGRRYSFDPESPAIPPVFRFLSESFPRSLEEVRRQFDIRNVRKKEDVYELSLKPIDKKMTRFLNHLVYFIDAEKFHLRGFEFRFHDETEIRTTFTRIEFNPTLDASLFSPDLEEYRIESPDRKN